MTVYELDFLPVETAGGGGSKSGDAITGQFWLPDGSRRVVVVDAGYSDIGDDVVNHIFDYYDTETIDIVVSTHPDGDHLNGLLTVLEAMIVGELLIHRPRQHLAPADVAYVTNLEMIDAVIATALSHSVTVTEPFTGLTRWGGRFRVLGPSVEYYEYLLSEHIEEERSGLGPANRAVTAALAEVASERGVSTTPLPFPPEETLQENPRTSHRNNTSTVVLLQPRTSDRILLTGDAGVDAMNLAALEYEHRIGSFASAPLRLFQVPHHGSANNVSPSLLDRIVGQKWSVNSVTAVVSSAKSSPHHPSPKVTNALIRRGADVVATEGKTVYVHRGRPRVGWGPASNITPLSE